MSTCACVCALCVCVYTYSLCLNRSTETQICGLGLRVIKSSQCFHFLLESRTETLHSQPRLRHIYFGFVPEYKESPPLPLLRSPDPRCEIVSLWSSLKYTEANKQKTVYILRIPNSFLSFSFPPPLPLGGPDS